VGFGLTFDAARGRTILFGGISVCGGSGCPYLNDTWEWDGIAWVERSIAVRPPLGADGSLAYDSSKGRSVLFGSRNCTGGTLGGCTTSYQTWEYGAACDVVGPGHPGGGLAITCTTPPVLGTTFCLSYPSALGSSYLALGPTPLLSPPIPLAPPGFCAPGSLYVLPIVLFPVAGNPASFCVPLPGAPQLAGASVVLQGAAPEAGGCFRLTDALVTILQAP
jgi:hypothetical protein